LEVEAMHEFEIDSLALLAKVRTTVSAGLPILCSSRIRLVQELEVEFGMSGVLFAKTRLNGQLVLSPSGEVLEIYPARGPRRASPGLFEFFAVAIHVEYLLTVLPTPVSDSIAGHRFFLEQTWPRSFADVDGFWSTIVDDIEIGDFDLE
jgi:hypothetical protein